MVTILMAGVLSAVFILASTLLQRKAFQVIMATLQELNAAMDSIQTGVNGLEAAIADLKRQVASGAVVSQADLDALASKAAAINADVADTSDQV